MRGGDRKLDKGRGWMEEKVKEDRGGRQGTRKRTHRAEGAWQQPKGQSIVDINKDDLGRMECKQRWASIHHGRGSVSEGVQGHQSINKRINPP